MLQQAPWLPQQPSHAVTAPAVVPGATSSTPSLSAYQNFASTAPAGFQLVETDLNPVDLQEEAQTGLHIDKLSQSGSKGQWISTASSLAFPSLSALSPWHCFGAGRNSSRENRGDPEEPKINFFV